MRSKGEQNSQLKSQLTQEAAQTADRVARQAFGKIVAFLASRTRDIAEAEDALSDAFAAALADWPQKGVPDRPEAWLVAVARRKLIDQSRKRRTGREAEDVLGILGEELQAVAAEAEENAIPDERLRLMFACGHPAID